MLYVWKGPYPWDVRVEKICTALIEAGNDVYMLARWEKGRPQEENIGGINVIRVGYGTASYKSTPLSVNPVWQKAIENAIIDLKPDLIIPREIMLAEACADKARPFNIPVVMDMAEHYPGAMKEWKKYRKTFTRRLLVHHLNLPELVEKRAVPKMYGIITVCSEQNERLEREYHFNRNWSTVVHNTPDLAMFSDVKKGPDKPARVFGHHGNMTDEKSLVLLLQGFILAAEKNKDIELLLAGDGESCNDLRKIAAESPFEDRIVFTGRYKYEDLSGILSRIDVGVIPYQVNMFNNNTLHNKVFDFFACGKPVIGNAMTPLKRVINETGAGVVLKRSTPEGMRDAILKMTEQDLSGMSEKGIAASKDIYNWSVDAERLVDFCNRFLKSK